MPTEQQDVVELLKAQHNQIRQLIDQVRAADGAGKREPFEDLVRLLAVHESAEEEVIHPAARRVYVADHVVESRLREEEKAKQALAELHDLGVEHRDFDAKFDAFATAVIDHAEHEEREEFERLREDSSAAERAGLATAVQMAEATAPTRPHPAAGSSGPANLLAGPPLAIFDRVRDTVRDWVRKTRG
ncbi:hemerythrin domain-containing protein [Nocardia wallacei]|uniref:hemerythrin domain-containing protein n=1 Tax=Nocardia TaxID=1817 RepID=UPI0024559F16|nr:hemerythrin domain-containing protein [Nocardia wallacei]